jgi:hypothetical protein
MSMNDSTIYLPKMHMVAKQILPKLQPISSSTTNTVSKWWKLDLWLDHTEHDMGIAAFFKPVSRDKYQHQSQDEYEAMEEVCSHTKWQAAGKLLCVAKKAREVDRIRKQKERKVKKQSEILDGLHSPGGTKVTSPLLISCDNAQLYHSQSKKRLSPNDNSLESDTDKSDVVGKPLPEASWPG